MREIKFRGQSISTKSWNIGLLLISQEGFYYIIPDLDLSEDDMGVEISNLVVPIIPETVGQYIGLKDKNGKEVYEGDIIRYDNSLESGTGEIEAFFNTANFHCRWITQKTKVPSLYTSTDYLGCKSEVEVIGNIHKDPGLLKGGSDG